MILGYISILGYSTAKCFKAQENLNSVLEEITTHQYNMLDRHEKKLRSLTK